MTIKPYTKKEVREIRAVRTEGLQVLADRNGEGSIACLALRLLATLEAGLAAEVEEED